MEVDQVIYFLTAWLKDTEYGEFKIVKYGKTNIDIETSERKRYNLEDKKSSL